MTDFNSLAINANKRLQRSVGLKGGFVDGYFGEASFEAMKKKGGKLAFDWDKLREHFGRFKQSQVDGFNAVLDALNDYGGAANKPTFAAYILATIWHETAHTMRPVEEYGVGRTRRYGKWYRNSNGVIYGHANDKGKAYLQSDYPHLYYGRGYPQLTWLDNYIKLGNVIGVNLASNPSLALIPHNSARITIAGMLGGLFTGVSLSTYINYGLYFEYVNARRVVNGTDRQKLIGEYAVMFIDSLIIKS